VNSSFVDKEYDETYSMIWSQGKEL